MNLRGIGTFEFLYNPYDGRIYCLEFNKRLQVEHRITEKALSSLGIDLDTVALQIRLAHGQSLPAQLKEKLKELEKDPTKTASVMEVRINVEPPPELEEGEVTDYRFPREWNVQVEDGFDWSRKVLRDFDHLAARAIFEGGDRGKIFGKASRYLEQVAIWGKVSSNIPQVQRVLKDHNVIDGNYNTETAEQIWGKAA